MHDKRSEYDVFVNCPFDDAYKPLFEAIVFAVHDCGYVARCSLEVTDASEVRIEKIRTIIASCRFGIHDISRTELDLGTQLPRFNMPLELGLFLGAKWFGSGKHKAKTCLILDTEQYRYQKVMSDIAGQDIKAHAGDPEFAIKAVRIWLNDATPRSTMIPSGDEVAQRYVAFRKELPTACDRLQLRIADLTFNDYVLQVQEWLKLNPRGRVSLDRAAGTHVRFRGTKDHWPTARQALYGTGSVAMIEMTHSKGIFEITIATRGPLKLPTIRRILRRAGFEVLP